MKGLPKHSQRCYSSKRVTVLWLLRVRVSCALWLGTSCTFAGIQVPKSARTLTFEQRAGYQYAIEEVYWRHRIWPPDNPAPKPPLDALISREQVEKKVRDYLGKSQAVAERHGTTITDDELQNE